MDIIKTFFPKWGDFFLFSKKGRGYIPSPPSCAAGSVAEYASISLKMPKYPWKCLNKLFWLCQGSDNGWSSYMFNRLLKMFWVLNKPGSEYGTVVYARVTQSSNMSDYDSILPYNAWICLNMPQCCSIFLNMISYYWMSLNMPENVWINCSNYTRVLNMSW